MTLFAEPPSSDQSFWRLVDDLEVHLVSALVAPWTAHAIATVPTWAIGYKEVNQLIVDLTGRVMSSLREACACLLAEEGVSRAMAEFQTDDPMRWSGMILDAVRRGHLMSRWEQGMPRPENGDTAPGLVLSFQGADFMADPATTWKDSSQVVDPESDKRIGMLDLGLEIRVEPRMAAAISSARQARKSR